MTDQPVRPDVRAFLDAIVGTPFVALETLGAPAARSLMDQLRKSRPSPAHELAIVRDLCCPGPGGQIKLRFYDRQSTRGPGPVVMYFHGGGFVLGDLDSHHQVCIDIAMTVDLPVIAVDYRLAPEHPFPAAVDDSEAAARWLAQSGGGAFDRTINGLVLAGDSAGANLAAVTTRALVNASADVSVVAQFLIYPTTGHDLPTRSKELFADGFFLTKAGIDWFNACYAAPKADPRYDLFVADLSRMPATLLVTAGLDPLRDAGRAYAAALVEVGVPVVFQEAKGVIHGFFGQSGTLPSVSADVARALAALRLLCNPH